MVVASCSDSHQGCCKEASLFSSGREDLTCCRWWSGRRSWTSRSWMSTRWWYGTQTLPFVEESMVGPSAILTCVAAGELLQAVARRQTVSTQITGFDIPVPLTTIPWLENRTATQGVVSLLAEVAGGRWRRVNIVNSLSRALKWWCLVRRHKWSRSGWWVGEIGSSFFQEVHNFV